MSNFVQFVPKHALDCQKNLNDFILRAKNELSIYEDQGGFASSNWKHRLANGRSQSMEFTGLAPKGKKTGTPMQQPFLDFAKAYVRDNQTWKATNPGNMMMVLKASHDALIQIYLKADVLLIDGIVVRKISELIYERSSEASRYRYGQMLEAFLEDLKKFKINITIPTWKNSWKRPGNKAQGTSKEDREWQEERLLSSFEIGALADAFRLAKTPYQKFYSAQSALLLAAPSRGGELGFLTVDCLSSEELSEIEKKNTGLDQLWNIAWKAEKGGGLIKKPIHPYIVPTIQLAIERLKEIGEPARKATQWAIEHPDEFYRHEECITPPDHGEDEPLTIEQFAGAMCIQSLPSDTKAWRLTDTEVFAQVFSQKWIHKLIKGKKYITYRDLAKYTIDKYKEKFTNWPFIPETGKPVSELLCLVRENEFHAVFAPKLYSFECPNLNLLNDALGAIHERISGKDSLFSQLGLVNEDGANLVITSHQIRVWLSTEAERGEMNSLDLAMYAGRSRVEDNLAYDLRTLEEKTEESRKLLTKLGLESLDGTKSLTAVKLNVPVTFKMLGHKDRVGTVQVSGYGYCEHDWTMTPCTKAGECISCKEHACVKGLPKNLEKLKELEVVYQDELNRAAAATNDGFAGANSWLIYHGKKLAIIKTLIKYLENDQLPDGLILRIPEELDISLTKIALGEQKLVNAVNEKNPISAQIIKESSTSFLALLTGEL